MIMNDTTLTGALSVEEAARKIEADARQREQERLTIALVGRGGAGKSSLINRMLGRKVCEVGVFTDQTQRAEKHEWKQVIFVDLPGYGTRSFSLDRVMTECNISSFDMFLWCASDKFLEEA
jgi:GTP-binding protein EngB required for normal cell division